MRLPIAKSLFITLCLLGGIQQLHAQASCENPLEYLALTEGNILINKEIEGETEGQAATAVLQNTIALEFNKIREWESKYSEYTQSVSGYASALNAATHIYDDALRIMIYLGKLGKAMSDNPQGIVATMSMNNLYVETVTELISCFTLIQNAVSQGGKENMLTGAERSQTLWAINDKMDSFSKKLQKLYLSIRYYQMMDVWQTYSAGMIERTNGNAARTAHERWNRAARTVRYHY